jgi:citrate lyase gamma subunit
MNHDIKLIKSEIEDLDLSGYAREAALDAARDDELTVMLARATHSLDIAERCEADQGVDLGIVTVLDDVRERFESRIRTVAYETVESYDVHGHTVNLRHRTQLDCPECDEGETDAYHLGSASEPSPSVGWVCGFCGAVIVTTDSGEIINSEPNREESR